MCLKLAKITLQCGRNWLKPVNEVQAGLFYSSVLLKANQVWNAGSTSFMYTAIIGDSIYLAGS